MSVRYSCNCPTFKRGDGYGISEEELNVRPTTVKSVHQRNELILFCSGGILSPCFGCGKILEVVD